ncbi:hypothetical protein N7478_013243 [Penicillium angulare]|uniref:uncharacterized protein n=1 Tax=Penicillium angulare TaxID=116970 RepID=UPI00253F7799|nr:uncharacterized protein N7478_013243 [Penicillium angulare]KAJ5257139.1 hypothetical protein N7478_013243 [Penicillium angulare]
MAEAVRISARSNHGCWTCRLRKKKCDENIPVCSACVSLELECHGYGPRPEWMDNGVLQRDQAFKFKRLVGQAKSKRGKRQQLLPNQSRALVSTIDMRPSSSSTKNTSSPPAGSQSLFGENLGAFPQDQLDYQESGVGLINSLDTLWSFWPPNDLSIMDDTSLDLEGYISPYNNCQNQHSSQQLVSPISFESIVPGKDIQSPIAQSIRSTSNELQLEDSASRDHQYHFQKTAPGTNYDPVGLSSQISNPSGDTEDALFMYYLDEVFYIQYPFFHCQRKQGRGWLFAILRRVKSVYHAALALSERQRLSSSPSRNSDIASSLIQLRSPNSHYDIAIRKVQAMINYSNTSKGRDLLLDSIEILMSILQLLFFETFNGGREKWQTHLRTASGSLSTLLQARLPPLTTPEDSMVPHSEIEMTTLCPEIECAFKFVIGSFIAFDIISSVSTRSSLILNINHLQVLETFEISLESHTGCRDSVMALILEISLLEKWKKEAQSANKLSFVDLVKRGDGIQGRLRQELAAIEIQTHSWGVGLGGSSLATSSAIATPNTPTPTHPEISKVFILSAITYLHVVVSGPYPEVPEIAESISETVHAFNSLKDPQLLRSLVWPFCISGCLALETHYGFFRGLVSRAGITQHATGVCFEALQIMEECWKTRVTSPEGCDWATAMQQRGCYVFLG